MGDDSDFDIILRVKSGDRSAFNILVKEYQQRIYAVIKRFIKDSEEAKDVTQESFIKAYKAIDSFRGESSFYTWVYRIAINLAKNYLASHKRRSVNIDISMMSVELMQEFNSLYDISSPEEFFLRDEMQEILNKTINELPNDLKTALTLRETEGLSYDEIAHVMNCPVGTVRSRIFRAREVIDLALKNSEA